MSRIRFAVFALSAGVMCAGQVPAALAQSSGNAPRHFRLTFVVTYSRPEQPAQSFVLDVPVSPDRPGVAKLNLSSSLTDRSEGSTQQTVQCTDVHQSATGLAAKVSFSADSVSLEPLPGTNEPIHSNFVFEQQVDVALGKPTQITREMPAANGRPAPPKITVTAVQL